MARDRQRRPYNDASERVLDDGRGASQYGDARDRIGRATWFRALRRARVERSLTCQKPNTVPLPLSWRKRPARRHIVSADCRRSCHIATAHIPASTRTSCRWWLKCRKRARKPSASVIAAVSFPGATAVTRSFELRWFRLHGLPGGGASLGHERFVVSRHALVVAVFHRRRSISRQLPERRDLPATAGIGPGQSALVVLSPLPESHRLVRQPSRVGVSATARSLPKLLGADLTAIPTGRVDDGHGRLDSVRRLFHSSRAGRS